MHSGKKCLYSGSVVVFEQKWLYSHKSGCIGAKVFVFVQNCSIRAKEVAFGQKWLYLGKLVVFGYKLLYSRKTGCIRKKWLCSGKSGFNREKKVAFRQGG